LMALTPSTYRFPALESLTLTGLSQDQETFQMLCRPLPTVRRFVCDGDFATILALLATLGRNHVDPEGGVVWPHLREVRVALFSWYGDFPPENWVSMLSMAAEDVLNAGRRDSVDLVFYLAEELRGLYVGPGTAVTLRSVFIS